MAGNQASTIKAVASLVAIAISGVVIFSMYGPKGCGADEENALLLTQLNQLPEVVEKGGSVKAVTREGDADADVYRYEAQIINRDGVAIGRLRGGRVAGFGTMAPRFQWYATPGVEEEWVEQRGRRWGRGDGGQRGEGRRRGEDRDNGPPPAAPPAE
jgi:hypothetical protein